MKTRITMPEVLRKRKLLFLLPLIFVPLLTLLFWSVKGGSNKEESALSQISKKGFNAELPGANLSDNEVLDKLSFYEKAAADSAKMEEMMKNDPYYLQQKSLERSEYGSSYDSYFPKSSSSTGKLKTSPYTNGHYQDPNEAKVYKKLDQLNAALSEVGMKPDIQNASVAKQSMQTQPSSFSRDQMVKKADETGEDPEIKQLEGMMDKILDIQHPDRLTEKLRKTSEVNKGQVFAVTQNIPKDFNSLLTGSNNTGAKLSNNRFYSLKEGTEDMNKTATIRAVIHQSQIITDGSIVKLRLLDDVFINGHLIPKNHFLFGSASLNKERLIIKVKGIRYNSSLYPVDLSVCDLDGIDGLHIPSAIARDVAKQSGDDVVQGISLSSLDPTLTGKAASAGIEAAKSLLSKRVNQIKVTVKSGHQVLLIDEKQNGQL